MQSERKDDTDIIFTHITQRDLSQLQDYLEKLGTDEATAKLNTVRNADKESPLMSAVKLAVGLINAKVTADEIVIAAEKAVIKVNKEGSTATIKEKKDAEAAKEVAIKAATEAAENFEQISEIIKLLLQKKPDLTLKDKAGVTALQYLKNAYRHMETFTEVAVFHLQSADSFISSRRRESLQALELEKKSNQETQTLLLFIIMLIDPHDKKVLHNPQLNLGISGALLYNEKLAVLKDAYDMFQSYLMETRSSYQIPLEVSRLISGYAKAESKEQAVKLYDQGTINSALAELKTAMANSGKSTNLFSAGVKKSLEDTIQQIDEVLLKEIKKIKPKKGSCSIS